MSRSQRRISDEKRREAEEVKAERRDQLESWQQAVRERWVVFEDVAESGGRLLMSWWSWISARPIIMRWSIAFMGAAAATVLGLAFRDYVTVGAQLMLFLPVVMLSTLYGGWITGAASSLMGASVALHYYFRNVDVALEMRQISLTGVDHNLLARQNYVALVLYAIACGMVIALGRAQDYHRDKARELAETLEQRIAERSSEAAAAHRELAEFCYSISHDLRAPMRNIIGSSRILMDESDHLKPEEIQRLQGMAASAQRLSKLVDDLLGYARLSDTAIEPEWIDLASLVEDTCEELRKEPWPCSTISCKVQPGLVLGGDPLLVSLVMRSLLENACKYSKPDRQLVIQVGEQRLRGRTWFFVRDNGIGLDMRFAHKIFEPFQKLHRDSEVAGTGIGLANVRRIVERHGGDIFVESELGKGATFYFNFGGLVPSAPRPSSNTLEPKTIILADQD